ncbi:DUF1801 domain-containing protein [Brevundimonas sp. R86498]|uniref:DUF1801 domain-containing protein n=1 Tax=Brevundimonas sp. R86498 TaxID=3093845 RepID=UPI0037CB63AB
MADAKTKPTAASVDEFIASVDNPGRREDAQAIVALLAEASGEPATMWGTSIIGFGRYHYRYDSGREGDAPLVAFSPRKANLVLYLAGEDPARSALLARLGRHRTGQACVYLDRLSDVDADVVRDLARLSIQTLKARYPG